MRGIVFDGERLRLTDRLDVRGPARGEVRVTVLRSGICHSDLNMMKVMAGAGPIVLGHEAAGVVAEIGEGVTDFAVGDEILVGTQTPCGNCRECLRGEPANCDLTWGMEAQRPFLWEGKPTYSFANVSSFAGEIVVKASQLFRTGGLPMDEAALIGCAVSTGYGAARVLGQTKAGDRVAVIGVGGIGVNAIAGARIGGASIMAVDLNSGKEDAARRHGAAAFLQVSRAMDAPAIAAAMQAAFEPIDIVIECSGAPVAAEAAIIAAKRGGRVVLIGQTAPGARGGFSLDDITMGREIIGRLNGGARLQEDYPQLIAFALSKEIDVAAQVTQVWPLAQFEDAIGALLDGRVTRAVLDHTT